MLKLLLNFFLLFAPVIVFSQEIIKVDAGFMVKDVSNHPVGINVNYLMDNDGYLNPATTTADALKEMGVKVLRFPGGEKSDNYIWGQRPFTSANHTLASSGNCYWPNNDSRFTQNDFKTLKSTTLNFDQFMDMAQQTGSQPLIVVNGDGHYRQANTCNGLPKRDSLLLVAREWVRYANIVKKHNIKYWMVGNETFYNTGYSESEMAHLYRQDLILFAQAMKAVDPTIKIIVNGKSENWWKIILSDPVAVSLIDYLGISVYPMWNWTNGYEVYRTTSPNFTEPLTTAANAVSKYVTNESDRNRIRLIATEVNAIDWGNKPWANTNDLAHALVTFDMLGKQLLQPKLDIACLWNTRWVNTQTDPDHMYDALSPKGRLQPTGQAVAIWGNFILDQLVSVNNTNRIVSYATRSQNKLNVILINKDTTAHPVNLNLTNFLNSGSATRYVYKGNSLTDTNPILSAATAIEAVAISKNTQYNFAVDGASITILSFNTDDLLLPVELQSFEVKKMGAGVRINWQTANEKNNAGFIIEVSPDARVFRKLAFVPSQKKTTTTHYTYSDQGNKKPGLHYYRLKQIDYSGKETTYETKSVNFPEEATMATISPNPGHQQFKLTISADQKKEIYIWIADKIGRKVYQNKIILEKGQNHIPINLSQNYSNGLYFCHILSEGSQQQIKFIKL